MNVLKKKTFNVSKKSVFSPISNEVRKSDRKVDAYTGLFVKAMPNARKKEVELGNCFLPEGCQHFMRGIAYLLFRKHI